jgi:hypothetical protein
LSVFNAAGENAEDAETQSSQRVEWLSKKLQISDTYSSVTSSGEH